MSFVAVLTNCHGDKHSMHTNLPPWKFLGAFGNRWQRSPLRAEVSSWVCRTYGASEFWLPAFTQPLRTGRTYAAPPALRRKAPATVGGRYIGGKGCYRGRRRRASQP